MHAVLAFSTLPLLLGALLADGVYARTAEVQWTNFASWLIAWALVFSGLALAWALAAAVVGRPGRPRRTALYLLLLAATFVLGLVNSLVHARDAWAAMPTAPLMSALVLLLAAASAGVGLAGLRRVGPAAAGVTP